MTDSERCVDELLKRLAELDAFLDSLDSSDRMMEARDLLKSSQSFIDNNHALIPGYCLKKFTDSLKRLENCVNNSSKSNMKFKFTAKEPSTAIPTTGVIVTNYTHARGNLIGFSARSNETLTMGPSEVESKEITLSQLAGCNVVIKGMANTVFIRDLTNTTVTVGIACRAVKIEKCSNCTFKLVCQQLRIDSALDCKFEIFTSARSMLESSNGLEFERLQPDGEMREFMLRNNMDTNSNNWKCIDDFDWLSPNVPSQHYKLVGDK